MVKLIQKLHTRVANVENSIVMKDTIHTTWNCGREKIRAYAIPKINGYQIASFSVHSGKTSTTDFSISSPIMYLVV